MTACPGCGIVLPGSGDPWNEETSASWACHSLYGEVTGYEFEHLAQVGRWHQLLVDTYAAQHVGDRTPPINTAFALIGLCLALEHGRSGVEIRDAHKLLADRYRAWPKLRRPDRRADMTIQDLAFAASSDEYAAILGRWARSVWDAWRDEHHRVAHLLRERLPGPISDALR